MKTTIKLYLIIAVLLLGAGTFGAMWIKGAFKTRAVATQANKNIKQSAKNVSKSMKENESIEARVAAGERRAAQISAAAAKRIDNQKEKSNEVRENSFAADYRLDVGTVRLLNAARQGAGVESAGGSDEALDAPSGVGVDALIQNDLAVVKQYHDLATRHDALVDWVEQKVREQAGEKSAPRLFNWYRQ
jgi:hypothetical protein